LRIIIYFVEQQNIKQTQNVIYFYSVIIVWKELQKKLFLEIFNSKTKT